jgi:hypothetical protein
MRGLGPVPSPPARAARRLHGVTCVGRVEHRAPTPTWPPTFSAGHDGVNVGALVALSESMLALVGALLAHVGAMLGGPALTMIDLIPVAFPVWQDAPCLGS